MTIFQKINLIPDLINEKKLTETQAVNYICTQLLKNPKLFIRENLEEDLISDLEYAHYSVDKAYDVDAMVWTSVEYCLGDFVDNYNYLIDYDEE